MKSVRWSIIVAALLVASCGPIGDPPAKDKAKAGDKTKPGDITKAADRISAANETQASDPEEFSRLKGEWQTVAIEWAGQKVPDDRVREINLQYSFFGDAFLNNRLTVRLRSGSIGNATYRVDTTTNPKRMMLPAGAFEGFLAGRSAKGPLTRPTKAKPDVKAIYSLEGNTLKLCLMLKEDSDAGYPAELVSQASPETDLLTLERP